MLIGSHNFEILGIDLIVENDVIGEFNEVLILIIDFGLHQVIVTLHKVEVVVPSTDTKLRRK